MELDCYKDGNREQDFKFLRVLGRGKHLGVILCVQADVSSSIFFFFFAKVLLHWVLYWKTGSAYTAMYRLLFLNGDISVSIHQSFLPLHTVHGVLKARMLK